MSYNEDYPNNNKKWQNEQFRRLFMQLLPKFLLGTVIAVVAVTIGESRAFRKPEVNFNHVYVEEDILHYEINIDAINSNLDVDSLIIRLESNSDKQEIEGVLGLQSGTFSISLYREYNLTVRGNIGWGDQVLAEKKVKALLKPYVPDIIIEQHGKELLIEFDIYNSKYIIDNKVMIQVLDGLKTIYMENHDLRGTSNIEHISFYVQNIKINTTYKVRIIASTPKKLLLHEKDFTSSNLPQVHLSVHTYHGMIDYFVIIEDYFEVIKGDVTAYLIFNNKVIDSQVLTSENISGEYYGMFESREPFEGDYEIVIKAQVGLKIVELKREQFYVPPEISLNYEKVGNELLVTVDISNYKMDEYTLYLSLNDFTTNEIIEIEVDKTLKHTFQYDSTHDYYLSCYMIRNDKLIDVTHYPVYIAGTITGNLVINNANIKYNSANRKYEVELQMNSTYPIGYYDSYDYELVNYNSYSFFIYDGIYEDVFTIPLSELTDVYKVIVNGYKNGVKTQLAERTIDNDITYAYLMLTPSNELVMFDIQLIGGSPDPNATYEIVARDSRNELSTIGTTFGNFMGEISVFNYGNAYLELQVNGVAIGGAEVFVYPYVYSEAFAHNWSFDWNYNFGNAGVTEVSRIDVYYNNSRIINTYDQTFTIQNPIENGVYAIYVILEDSFERTIYYEEYTYINPNMQDELNISNAEYLEAQTGTTGYILRIYFQNTYTDQTASISFTVDTEDGTLAPVEAPVTNSYINISVPEIYYNLTITVRNNYGDIVLVVGNIPITTP